MNQPWAVSSILCSSPKELEIYKKPFEAGRERRQFALNYKVSYRPGADLKSCFTSQHLLSAIKLMLVMGWENKVWVPSSTTSDTCPDIVFYTSLPLYWVLGRGWSWYWCQSYKKMLLHIQSIDTWLAEWSLSPKPNLSYWDRTGGTTHARLDVNIWVTWTVSKWQKFVSVWIRP